MTDWKQKTPDEIRDDLIEACDRRLAPGGIDGPPRECETCQAKNAALRDLPSCCEGSTYHACGLHERAAAKAALALPCPHVASQRAAEERAERAEAALLVAQDSNEHAFNAVRDAQSSTTCAEEACAAMREALSKLVHIIEEEELHDAPCPYVDADNVPENAVCSCWAAQAIDDSGALAALSSDAGRGWLSPSEAAKLREERDEAVEEERQAWQEASGLVSGGDPGGVTTEMLARCMGKLYDLEAAARDVLAAKARVSDRLRAPRGAILDVEELTRADEALRAALAALPEEV